MNYTTRSLETTTTRYAILLAVLLLVSTFNVLATEEEEEPDGVLYIGLQGNDVDADENRDAKFERNRDLPDGLVFDYLRWSQGSGDRWFQVKAWDASQLDEGAVIRAGVSEKVQLRASYQSTPHRYGDRATFVLGRGAGNKYGPSYRMADFAQMTFEDPDGDGVPFFSGGLETPEDNGLVFDLTNDLLSGQDRFSLSTRRRSGSLGLTAKLSRNWTLDVDVIHETRDGLQALGSGTYQRLSDVNDNGDGTYGDGATDYDYFFSVRGTEIPAIIDYRTTRAEAFLNYQNKDWFVNFGATVSEFENAHLGITYDNPFWFNGVDATSGSRRGLWEEGRASLEPSNKAWDVRAVAGVNLPARTRITAAVSIGEHTQDDPFMPITTNPATIGTDDINRDGVTDAADDPTLAPADIPGMPSSIDGTTVVGSDLDATSDITALNLTVTSRPVKPLTLTARYRSYEYEGGEGIQVIPSRTEYIESHVKLDFKGDLILHVPNEFTRENTDLEAAWRFSNNFKLKGFAKRKHYDYELYKDPDGNVSRDSGTRAVSETDDDIFGLSALFGGGGWFSGRATVQTAEREFGGVYTPGFSGENLEVRQYDIANRERDAADLQLDFMPAERVSLGVGYRFFEDDYPDTVYGLQSGETSGLSLNVGYSTESGVDFFVYGDVSDWDADMHLRTKCANCAPPPGASWSGAWGVPNFDWFSEYQDTTTAMGGGVSFKRNKTKFDLMVNYVDGQVEQTTRNPDTPVNLQDLVDNPRSGEVATVALGFDFPDQENTLISTELQVTRKINDKIGVGIWWLYEDFDLDDFQWDNLEPYGQNFLDVRVPGADEIGDDATRYLFLDSRYRDYTAHVLQVFVKFLL